jgi:NADH-quinone oxidoreductase subunit M
MSTTSLVTFFRTGTSTTEIWKSTRTGYRQNYFFWCFHLGWTFLFVGVTAGVAGVYPGVTPTVWAPAVAAALYPVGVRYARPGAVALWLSLAAAAVSATGSAHPDFARVGYHTGGGWVLDAVTAPYVFLTVTLIPVVVLASLESVRKNEKMYYFWILLLGGVLTLCFCASNFLVFYVLFEILGFPMFLLVGQYGPRPQRVAAAYKFFVYTFAGAAFVLPVLVYLQFWWGTTEVTALCAHQFTEYEQILFFGLCAVPFAVKIPLVPFHLWLPEAHVEAPTPVSMLLAGLLLKTGGYAFIRFLLPAFPAGAYVWGPALCGIGLFSVVFASLYALVQVDMKRMIAYASVAHMSVVFLGVVSGTAGGLAGATYLMLAHGYTSAGLFGGIGVLYDRYHTRTIRRYGGLVGYMPGFALLFFVLTLGNLSFPFTGGFTGEFMVLSAVALCNPAVTALAGATVFLSLCYSVWLFNRLFYGPVASGYRRHADLTPVEVGVLGWCTVGCVGLGWLGGAFVGYTQNCYLGVLHGCLPG